MKVDHVDVLVEEASMEAALALLLPRLLGEVAFKIHPHMGKDDLLGKLPDRLRGYASWMPETMRILVIVDQDDDACIALKKRMDQMVVDAGLVARSKGKRRYRVATVVVIEELEAWFFGDWQAVRQAYPRVDATVPTQSKYRDPDRIRGTWEALERELRKAGVFKGRLRKIETARAVAAQMMPARNASRSFQAFCRIVAECTT